MRRAIVLLPVVGLLAALLVLSNAFRPPVDAQDRTEERLTALETRVAALETAVAGGAAGSSGGASASSHLLTGTFQLKAEGYGLELVSGDVSAECRGRDGWDLAGFEVGAQVTVKNETEKVVAVGEIVGSEAITFSTDRGVFEGLCLLTFVVEDVPAAAFYQIEAADQAMPLVSYEELEAQGWTVEFTIR